MILPVPPGRTALLVVDVQLAFAAFAPGAEAAIDRIEALLAAARAAGVTVAFSRVVTRPDTDPANMRALYAWRGLGDEAAAICRAGSTDAAYHRVRPAPGEIEVEKTRYSSFVGTALESTLRARGVETIVVAGLTTECCVDCTVRDAFHRDFHVLVAADACADADAATHAAALASLGRHCALVVQSAELIAAWEAMAQAPGGR